jgi:hypothetical protein
MGYKKQVPSFENQIDSAWLGIMVGKE